MYLVDTLLTKQCNFIGKFNTFFERWGQKEGSLSKEGDLICMINSITVLPCYTAIFCFSNFWGYKGWWTHLSEGSCTVILPTGLKYHLSQLLRWKRAEVKEIFNWFLKGSNLRYWISSGIYVVKAKAFSLFRGFISLLTIFQSCRDLKQEIPNLWNSSGETRNLTPHPLLQKPIALPIDHRRSLQAKEWESQLWSFIDEQIHWYEEFKM